MSTSRRPHTLLAMAADVREAFIDGPVLDQLRHVATIDPGILAEVFSSPSAPGLEVALKSAEVLLTSWGCPELAEGALARMPSLRVVVHAAGSVKGIVTDAMWERGITVSSAAAANALPVAEFTVAAVLFSNKSVLGAARSYPETRRAVDRLTLFSRTGNYRRTVGIVGASLVGRRVIELLQLYDIQVPVYDPCLEPGEAARLGARQVDLDGLALRSDIVSIHAPGLPETRHLFDRSRLALMPDGATLISTARGSLVDTDALTAELLTGRLHAVLDVTEHQPPRRTRPCTTCRTSCSPRTWPDHSATSWPVSPTPLSPSWPGTPRASRSPTRKRRPPSPAPPDGSHASHLKVPHDDHPHTRPAPLAKRRTRPLPAFRHQHVQR